MTCVHCIYDVERLGSATVPHDDSRRAHVQRIHDEILDGNMPCATYDRGTRLQLHQVFMTKLQLCGVFYGDQSFVGRDKMCKNVKKGRLAGIGTPRDKDVLSRPHGLLQEGRHLRRHASRCNHPVQIQWEFE